MVIFNSYVKLPEGIILMRKSTISTGPFSSSQTVSLFTRPGKHRSIVTPPFLDHCPLNPAGLFSYFTNQNMAVIIRPFGDDFPNPNHHWLVIYC